MINFNLLTKTQNQIGFIVETQQAMKILEEKNLKRKNDCVLFLQIDSVEDKTGMMLGDCGRIYFWIKKQDLLNKNFDNTWCILQCY